MQFTAQQVATLIQGKLEGNPEAKVSNVAKIEEADEYSLSFIANPKYEEYLYSSKAAVIIINETLEITMPVKATLVRVKDPYISFAYILEKYKELFSGKNKVGIDKLSFIASSASIGKEVYIGAFSYIGENAIIGNKVNIYPGCYIGNNVVIEEATILYAGVKIYDDCIIGKNNIIHAGTVIGADGFGFAPQNDASYKKIPQIGNVILADEVEVGANTTIDRATMGSTIIHNGVKLDNLIQIGHNVEIGENTVIVAQTGISGSTKLGRNIVIGGQAGVVGHITIADGTKINAQSGVSKSVTENNSVLSGSPAFDYRSSLKSQAIFRNLPELQQRIFKLEEIVSELTTLLSTQNTEEKR